MKNILFYSLILVSLTTLITFFFIFSTKKETSNVKKSYTIYAYISKNSSQPIVMLKRD